MRVTTGTASLYMPAIQREQDKLREQEQLERGTQETSARKARNDVSAAMRRQQAAYGGSAAKNSGRLAGQAALNRALGELAKQTDGKITFDQVFEHRKNLEEVFSKDLKTILEAHGVPADTDFKLTMGTTGQIDVQCDDPVAKAKIEKCLEDYPKVREQFEYIQSLSNLERAQKIASANPLAAMRDTGKALRAEVMESFFDQALDDGLGFSSILADFDSSSGSDAASFYTGLNYTI